MGEFLFCSKLWAHLFSSKCQHGLRSNHQRQRSHHATRLLRRDTAGVSEWTRLWPRWSSSFLIVSRHPLPSSPARLVRSCVRLHLAQFAPSAEQCANDTSSFTSHDYLLHRGHVHSDKSALDTAMVGATRLDLSLQKRKGQRGGKSACEEGDNATYNKQRQVVSRATYAC